MQSKIQKYGFRLLPLITLFTTISCATDNAEKVRQERPYTVGYLGGGYRPKGNMGINVYPSYTSARFGNSPSTESSSLFKEETDRDLNLKDFNFSGSFIYFPWHTSAFNMGISVKKGTSTLSYNADGATSTAVSSRINVEYQRSYTTIGIPVGWYWIWENGFTLSLDFGPRWRVTNSLSWNYDGGTAVNQSERDSFQSKMENVNAFTLGGAGIIGYSF